MPACKEVNPVAKLKFLLRVVPRTGVKKLMN